MQPSIRFSSCTLSTILLSALASGQLGTVVSEREVVGATDVFPGLEPDDGFGTAIANLWSFGLGTTDRCLALGVPGDDEAGTDRGAVWVVREVGCTSPVAEKLSSSSGSFDGVLHDGDRFGASLVEASRANSTYSTDLFIGAPGDDAAGADAGAVWWSYTDRGFAPARTEQSVEITAGRAGFAGPLAAGDGFGSSITAMMDRLNAFKEKTIVVGAPGDDDGGPDRGAIWILLLDDPTRQVVSAVKISSTSAGIPLSDGDRFGSSVTWIPDLDNDNIHDLAVGAPGDDGDGVDRGAVWILLLDGSYQVKSVLEISSTSGALAGLLHDGDELGTSLQTWLSPFIGQCVITGAPGDDDGGPERGAIWSLYLLPDLTTRFARKVSSTQGLLSGPLEDSDRFGAALAQGFDRFYAREPCAMPTVGSPGNDGGGADQGAYRALELYGKLPQILSWSGSPRLLAAPGNVRFESTTQGYITSSSWDFGDGGTSDEPDPTHLYTVPGLYDVTLTISSIDGSDTETKLAYIDVRTGGLATPYSCQGYPPPGFLSTNLSRGGGGLGAGDSLTLYLYDFFETMSPGSLSFLTLSAAPDPAFPCGIPAPQYSILPFVPGEILLDLTPGVMLSPIFVGTPLSSSTSYESHVTFTIPPDPGLEGVRIYAQGLFLDTSPGATQRFGVTTGLEIVIGPPTGP